MSFVHVNNSIPDFIAISKMKNAFSENDNEVDECFNNNYYNLSKYLHENKTPKILIMSLEAMYKTIQDTYESNPIVCCKFLQSILTYLESLQPGDWVSECDDIIDYLFKLLLGIVQTIDIQTSRVINRSRSMTNSISNSAKNTNSSSNCYEDGLPPFDCNVSIQKNLCNIATACLFSIGIAKGNISMLLVAVNTVLIRNGLLDDNDFIQTPNLVLKLKKCSDWSNRNQEIPVSEQFCLINQLPDNVTSESLISNGTYLFWLTSIGLLKIGTGFNGSIQGFVYQTNEELAKYCTGWMGIVSNSILLHVPLPTRSWKMGEMLTFYKINIDNLQIDGQVNLKITNFHGFPSTPGWKYYLFANYTKLGCCLINEDETYSEQLFMKLFKLNSEKFLVEECEKSIDMTQHLILKFEIEQSKIFSNPSTLIETCPSLSLACEVLNLEEFCVVRNQSGEIFYKDIDNVERNNNVENWTRLLYTDYVAAKFHKLIGGIDNKFICAISDDGLWRININRHSQPRTLCLDRLMPNSRFISKTWASGSCSKDNLALVSKEGQVLFLEKDSIHSLSTCYGALLSPYHVTQISLGKSHGACLSRNGYLITFGVNNYYQCGCVSVDNDGKYNEIMQEIDNNNVDSCSQIRSKHQVPTIKPQKLLIYSDTNASSGIKNRSNFLRIQQISCGHYHTVILTVNGDVYSFGNNKFNQLGRGYLSNKELPKVVPIQCKSVRITTGSFSTGILSQNGKVFIFGNKITSPQIIDLISNPNDLTDNLQPIFFNLSTNNYKKQIIFCILKQNIFYMKRKPLTLSTHRKSYHQDQFKFLAKDNTILLTLDEQRGLLINISSGTIKIMPDYDEGNFSSLMNSYFDPRYSVLWSIDSGHGSKKFTVKYSKSNIFQSDHFQDKFDQLIDLPNDISFSSQRYRIALNVLVSAEKLLLKKYADSQNNNQIKTVDSNKEIFTVKRFTKENSNWLYSPNAHDSIKFSVSETIYIHGIGLYTGPGENTMSIKIYEETGHDSDTDDLLNTNLFSYDTQFSSLLLLTETDKVEVQNMENKKIIRLMLPSPIILFSNKLYVIVATITGDSTDFGFHGRSKIDTDLGVTFKFKQSKNSSNGTHVKEGQIPEIYYSPRMPDIHKLKKDNEKSDYFINAENFTEYLSSQISMNSLTSAVALLNWIYTGLTCMFSELPDLQSDSSAQTYSYKLLKSLETLKLYSKAFTSTLKIIRKHIQYLYPFNGYSKDTESQETSVVIGDFRIIVRNIFLECKICHYLQSIKSTYGAESLIYAECWKLFTEDLIPVYKETFEHSFHAFYPEIEDQRFTLQEALLKVYEFCFNKSTDTLCNYGKIMFLTSLLTAINSANEGFLIFTHKDNSVTRSGENKINGENNFADRFPLLREYMRTIWKPSTPCSSDILASTSTMIHCLLAIITLDIKTAYKTCKQINSSSTTENDVSEKKLFQQEMTNLINASHQILTNITRLLVDQLNHSAKTPAFRMSQVNSTNSKQNGHNNNQTYLEDIILTTQSRFKRVVWLDKSAENSRQKFVEQAINVAEQEIEDVICFAINKNTNQFINGFEVVGDNVIYLEGIKVYCSNFTESRCLAYIYRTKNFQEGIQEKWELIPMEYEWKNEEQDLIASDLIFKRKLKLEESYRYAVKVFLIAANNKKTLIGQNPVSKLGTRFGYHFNLYETKLRTTANQNSRQGIIFSLLYSFSTKPQSVTDNQRLERKCVKMCLIELLAQVKYGLVTMIRETNPEELLSIGQKLFIDTYLPFFCHQLQLVSNVSKKITCLSITFVRETLIVIQENWKTSDKLINSEKDYFTIIESNHPYEQAKLLHNTIKFPDSVDAISITFDGHCVTAQPEDFLVVKARTNKANGNQTENKWKIIFKNLSNIISDWPKKAVIIQGNEIAIEFHTASLYEESLESTYGFKCSIVGHCSKIDAFIELLENALTYLASRCATSLLEFRKKSKVIKLLHETNILQKCEPYRSILDQGLSLSKLPTLTDCLSKSQLEYINSIQTTFVKKFVEGSNYYPETSCSSPAVQLSKWLQSCSVVIVSNCRLKLAPTSMPAKYLDELKSSSETNIVGNQISTEVNKEIILQLELLDQYENQVTSQMSNIEVLFNYNHKGNNPFININEKLFGGHPVPNTTVPFERTIIGKDIYQSITMMKNYEAHSFEEIRAAGFQETVCKSQRIKYRWSEEENSFFIDWIPKACGKYNLVITIDKIILKNSKTSDNITLKIDVTKSSLVKNGPVEKIRKRTENNKDKNDKPKYLWFEGKQSSGLRLRSQPSFNSPVLGIIPCNTVLRYEEELFTENSVWVRLHFDSFNQWYGYYPSDPLDQRPIVSIEPVMSNQETIPFRRKAVTIKPQVKSSGFCKKTVKSNLKPFTEGWCLKEHLNKIFLTPAKINYAAEILQKENIFKILSDTQNQLNNAPYKVLSKTLPYKRRQSARSNQAEFSKYSSNTVAISLPNSPDMTLRRKTQNKLTISSSASSSQPNSPGIIRRRSTKGPALQNTQMTGKINALSPLQAETQRALFAAIIWQNGLVSDLIQIAESINLYSAYHQLEKQINNSTNIDDNRNIPPFDAAPLLSNGITRSNSQNTGDMSLLSDSGGLRNFSISAIPRVLPSLADLVANAVAATSNSISNDLSPSSNKSPPRPSGSIKRSQSHMDGRSILSGQYGPMHYRDRFYSQVKEEETTKLGLHVSLDEELLNIGKPSSSNCRLSENLQSEILNKLNQLTKLWDTVSAILTLSEQQNQFTKEESFSETTQMSSGNSICEEMTNMKHISTNFYQKVYDNSVLLLEIEPANASAKSGFPIVSRDINLNSKNGDHQRILSPNHEDEAISQSRKTKRSLESCFVIPCSSKYFPESEIDLSRSIKLKSHSPTKIYANFWPLHNLQRPYTFGNNLNLDEMNDQINTAVSYDDSSIYLKCDCWSCLPLLKELEPKTKANFSSGNLTANSVPNSSFGAGFSSTAMKQHMLKLSRTDNSSWEHNIITSSDSNSASIKPHTGSSSCHKSATVISQLLQSMMSLLVNIVASSSSGMEIFERSMTGSNFLKKDCPTRGMLEMRFCLCYSFISELRLALEVSLRTLTIEQYSYQTYFWLLENVRNNSSLQIVIWCMFNLLEKHKSIDKSNKPQISLIEEKNLKVYSQQLWAVGSAVFYRILDNIIHNSNLNNLSVSEIKLLEMTVKISSLLLFADGTDESFSQSFINFEKSQVFSCLSELLNHLDDSKVFNGRIISTHENSIKINSPMDITGLFSCTVTSNSDSAQSLFDNNTDIFWESSGTNLDLFPCILLKVNQKCSRTIISDQIIVSVYLDRTRDIINGHVTATVRILKTAIYQQVVIEPDHIGWISFHLENANQIENGINIGFHVVPDEDLHASAANGMANDKIRVRAVKVLDASESVSTTYYTEDDQLKLRYDLLKEETLKSFIEMTNHIFYNCFTTSYQNRIEKKELQDNHDIESKSLHDFLVNILFDTGFKSEVISSRLSSLQRRVLSHIITQINVEVTKMLIDRQDGSVHINNDNECKHEGLMKKYDPTRCSCCFQLLNQVLALSGAQAGLRYLIHQAQLIRDLIILLYIGSDKIRQQVMFAITRIFSAVSPRSLEDILFGVIHPNEFENPQNVKIKLEKPFIPLNLLIIFAGKSLSIQMKSKSCSQQSGLKPFQDFLQKINNLPNFIQTSHCDSNFASKIYQLICQLSDENNHAAWFVYIQEWLRDIFECFMAINQNSDFINWENPNLYFLICLLPLFENAKLANFWNNLSSTARVLKSGEKKMCTNHDDESTIATVICYTCQPISNATDPTDLSLSARLIFLCAECDRYLHLSKMTKYHIRDNLNIQPISPKDNLSLCDCIVNSHESCVRLKSSKFIVTVDTSTLKILINLSQNAMNNNNTTNNNNNDITPNNTDIEISKPSDQNERCRFCNETSTNVDNKFACLAQECQIKSSVACSDKIQPCGHWCLGVVLIGKNESKMKKVCPPLCIVPTCSNQSTLTKFGLKQDGDDVCMICFTDTLSEGPIIILENCRHMLHYHCARRQILAGWPGYRVSFNFRKCPFCKQKIEHPALQDLLEPYDILEKEVKRKALLRLEHEGLIDSPEMKDSDGAIKELPEEFALHKYCYYLCYKCKNSYYGGEARCEPDMLLNTQTNNDRVNNSPVMDPATELCCAACSDVAQAKICPKHSTDFLEYKCRYCCSIAVFFCFGTTHFCQRCHDNLDTVLKAPWLPQCPAGPALQHLSTPECPLHVIHPPTGEEFALGCALCRKLDTF